MANLREFNFRHQTAAPSESHRPPASESFRPRFLSEGGRGANHLRGGGHAAGQVAKNFQAEQPLKSQGDAC